MSSGTNHVLTNHKRAQTQGSFKKGVYQTMESKGVSWFVIDEGPLVHTN